MSGQETRGRTVHGFPLSIGLSDCRAVGPEGNLGLIR